MIINDKRFRGFVIVLAVIIVLTLLESGRRRRKRSRVFQTVSSQDTVRSRPDAHRPFSNTGGFSVIPEPNKSLIQAIYYAGDGTFPNNARLPLLLYQRALPAGEDGTVPSECVYAMIESHQWGNAWNNGIYPYHHYHSTAHEVLFVCHGKATIQFGGAHGRVHTVRAGDVVVVPAGVAHKRLDTDPDLVVIGAYPTGQSPDMCLGEPEERPDTDQNIDSVPLPAQDPVYGEEGPMMRYWRQPQSL